MAAPGELGIPPSRDDADDRWRDVLFELMKRAKEDPEFRARVEATGAVLDGHFEAVLDRVHRNQSTLAGPIACVEYWWGFQLSIPHAMLVLWPREVEPGVIVAAIGPVKGPASAFVRRAAYFVATRLGELGALDRGDGLHVSMTWMAPNIFVPVAPR
ncbi:MAG: hypothetical protein ABI467_33060 [Kofleriaceae bacterium]